MNTCSICGSLHTPEHNCMGSYTRGLGQTYSPAMTQGEPLTREQVEKILDKITEVYEWKHVIHYLRDTDAALREQLATARREVWLEAAKACEKLYDASSDREAVFYEALLDAARACREQAKKEQP